MEDEAHNLDSVEPRSHPHCSLGSFSSPSSSCLVRALGLGPSPFSDALTHYLRLLTYKENNFPTILEAGKSRAEGLQLVKGFLLCQDVERAKCWQDRTNTEAQFVLLFPLPPPSPHLCLYLHLSPLVSPRGALPSELYLSELPFKTTPPQQERAAKDE